MNTNTENPKVYGLVDAQVKGAEFVRGNTKNLTAMNQLDLAVLYANGDARVKCEDANETQPVSSATAVKSRKAAEQPEPNA